MIIDKNPKSKNKGFNARAGDGSQERETRRQNAQLIEEVSG